MSSLKYQTNRYYHAYYLPLNAEKVDLESLSGSFHLAEKIKEVFIMVETFQKSSFAKLETAFSDAMYYMKVRKSNLDQLTAVPKDCDSIPADIEQLLLKTYDTKLLKLD